MKYWSVIWEGTYRLLIMAKEGIGKVDLIKIHTYKELLNVKLNLLAEFAKYIEEELVALYKLFK